MSNEMILDRVGLNDGDFSFSTQYLPANDILVRVHISKKTDPPASLIIGGKDENFIFVIVNNESSVSITGSSGASLFKNAGISGYHANNLLRQVEEISGYLDTTNYEDPPVKSELIRSAIFEKLRSFADTCPIPLVGLYAVYKSQFETNYPVNQQFYKNLLKKWKSEKSSYFSEFRNDIRQLGDHGRNKTVLIGLICFFTGILATILTLRNFRNRYAPLKNLSVQERKIFALLLEGKSNKEISEVLKIGLSTVKSHIGNIYSKLSIRSRKDALNLNMDLKERP
jgi:DNA-binding CsgD family transcriptional regulator